MIISHEPTQLLMFYITIIFGILLCTRNIQYINNNLLHGYYTSSFILPIFNSLKTDWYLFNDNNLLTDCRDLFLALKFKFPRQTVKVITCFCCNQEFKRISDNGYTYYSTFVGYVLMLKVTERNRFNNKATMPQWLGPLNLMLGYAILLIRVKIIYL